MILLLLLLAMLSAPASAQAQNPITGNISAAGQTVVLSLGGNTSVRVNVDGTFIGWLSPNVTDDPACVVRWQAAHWVDEFYTTATSAVNASGNYEIFPLAGIRCVRVIVYGTAPPYGFTSGTAIVTISATGGAAPTILPSGGHVEARFVPTQSPTSLNTKPACSNPGSVCVPASIGPYGGENNLTLPSVLAQNVCVRALYISMQGVSSQVRIRIIDGSDGEAVDFGVYTIDPNGPSWVAPLPPTGYCGATGNDVTINVSAPGLTSRTKIQAISDR